MKLKRKVFDQSKLEDLLGRMQILVEDMGDEVFVREMVDDQLEFFQRQIALNQSIMCEKGIEHNGKAVMVIGLAELKASGCGCEIPDRESGNRLSVSRFCCCIDTAGIHCWHSCRQHRQECIPVDGNAFQSMLLTGTHSCRQEWIPVNRNGFLSTGMHSCRQEWTGKDSCR